MPKGIYKRTDAVRKLLSDAQKKRIRTPLSEETKQKISVAQKGKPRLYQRGEKSGNWKGEALGYAAAHSYLREYHSNKKKYCVHCGSTARLQFAKKTDRTYTRNIDDYLILCDLCHLKYDGNLVKGRTPWNKGNVAVYPKICEFCKLNFNGVKKTRRFCSNSCSQRWLALQEKK